jgi:hypothetical protein
MNTTRLTTVVLRRSTAAAVAALLLIAGPAQARETTTADGHKMICLPAQDVQNTEALNDHQMLFHMRGHKTYVNTLSVPCGSLKDINVEGFVWVADTPTPEYCDNMEHIRVRQTGETCMLGAFSLYDAPAAK